MSSLKPDVLRFDLPCQEKYLQVVRLALHGAASRAGLTIEDIEDLTVAVSEACNNVLYHAFDEETLRTGDPRMLITLHISDGEVRVEVEDQGHGFDPKHVLAADQSELPTTQSYGLYLIRAFTDEMKIESAPGSGTRISFVKRVSK
ncbi:MAG: ATP-binding protein [Armatimonadetes bacterium]|nr:ATP-binding protein [Armatimonadota bacterium]